MLKKLKGERLFTIMRYYLATLSVVFSFIYLYYITMIFMGILILIALFGWYDYKPNKEDVRNYIGALLFVIFSIIVCFLVPKTYVVLILNLLVVLIIIILTEKIRKTNGWSNPFVKKPKQ